MRHSGLNIIGDVPWGTHFCQFYQTPQDLLDVLVSYFRQGLLDNEYCMWVTSEPLGVEEARSALRQAVPDLDDRIERVQIEFLDYRQWYTLGGQFDSDRVLAGWVQREQAALERGFAGLRLSGNTFWLEKRDWKGFADYEQAVDRVIGSHRMMALCTYSLDRCGAFEIMDVVRNHQFALTKQVGKWELIQSLRYRQTEEALRASEAESRRQKDLLAVTLASIGDGVMVTDTQGRVTFLNPEAERLTGWTCQEAAGQPLPAVFRIINEENRQPVENPVDKVLRHGTVVGLANHTLLVAKDGRETPIDDSGAPIRQSDGTIQGVVLVFRDFTEQKKAEQALRESEQRVRRKLDSVLSPEGDIGNLELADILDVPIVQALMDHFYELARIPMAILDRKGKVLVGVGWQDICTKFHRVHPETCQHCHESDTQLSAGVAPGHFKLYRCKNHMWDIATPIVVGGQHMGNLFAGQFFFEGERLDYDVFRAQARRYGFEEQSYIAALEAVPRLSRQTIDTGMAFFLKLADLLSRLSYSNIKLARSLAERDALTDSLRAAKVSAEHAKAMAESANRAKDQFIAVLSHELRTPLTPAVAAMSLLRTDVRLPADVREDLQMVSRNLDLEVRLIADLLDVSRIISGKLHLEKRPMDVAAAIQEAASIVSGDLDAKGQTLTVEMPGAPYRTFADGARLQQVFWNLLRNAVKFSPERGRITVRCKLVPVDRCPLASQPCVAGMGDCPLPGASNGNGQPCGGNLIVEVTDHGSGIAPEMLPRLFNAFEQEQKARSFGGLGLGLSICKGVVEMHGGSISAHSDGIGCGATFTVRLPVAQCPLTAPTEPAAPQAQVLAESIAPARDNGRLHILLVEDHPDTAKLMSRLLMAEGHIVVVAGSVADGLSAARETRLDVLISDLGLPDGSGLNLMQQLVAEGRRIPAIALSGYGAPGDIEKSKAAGFAEHLTKPLHSVELLTSALARLGVFRGQ